MACETAAPSRQSRRSLRARAETLLPSRRTTQANSTPTDPSPHSRSNFKTDVSATQDQQVFRNRVEFQGLNVSEWSSFRHTGQVRDFGPGANVEEDLLAVQNAIPSSQQRDVQGPVG